MTVTATHPIAPSGGDSGFAIPATPAGQPITFQARSFLMNYKPMPKTPSEIEERWDFGDGSTGVSHSDGNAVKLAPNGYGRIQHTYAKPGRYLVKVESTSPDGAQARMFLDVIVDK